jgi:hypothetical protein
MVSHSFVDTNNNSTSQLGAPANLSRNTPGLGVIQEEPLFSLGQDSMRLESERPNRKDFAATVINQHANPNQ